MRKLTFFLLSAAMAFLLFAACGGGQNSGAGGSATGTQSQSETPDPPGPITEAVDKEALAALTLEQRIQNLQNAASVAGCNTVFIKQVELGPNESLLLFTEDNRQLTLSREGCANYRLYCNYGQGGFGNNSVLYYYGEILEDGNLDNVYIKGVHLQKIEYTNEYELQYGIYNGLTAEEYIAVKTEELRTLATIPEQQVVLSVEEAIFYVMENEGCAKEFGMYYDPENLVKITLPGGWYYFQSGDMYFYFVSFSCSVAPYHGDVGIHFYLYAYHGGPYGTDAANWAFDCFVNSDGTIDTFMF